MKVPNPERENVTEFLAWLATALLLLALVNALTKFVPIHTTPLPTNAQARADRP